MGEKRWTGLCAVDRETRGSEGSEELDDMGSLLATRGHGDIGPQLLPRAVSGSVILLQLRSLLMSVTCVTTEGLQLKYEGQSEPVLPFTGPGKAGPTP